MTECKVAYWVGVQCLGKGHLVLTDIAVTIDTSGDGQGLWTAQSNVPFVAAHIWVLRFGVEGCVVLVNHPHDTVMRLAAFVAVIQPPSCAVGHFLLREAAAVFLVELGYVCSPLADSAGALSGNAAIMQMIVVPCARKQGEHSSRSTHTCTHERTHTPYMLM